MHVTLKAGVKFCFRCKFSIHEKRKEAMPESSLTLAWFSWTNHNSFATDNNQWDCFICIDNRLRQTAFSLFFKVGRVGKVRLSESCWKILKYKSLFCGSLFLYCIEQIDSMLPCLCLVKDRRRRQNVVRTSGAHSAIALCATLLSLPHFDVICDLLLNRRAARWNLFVNLMVKCSDKLAA